MKNNFIKFIFKLPLVLAALALIACKGEQNATETFGVKNGPNVSINLMAVSPANKYLYIGESAQFSATGGSPGYTYELDSGVGHLDSAGLYTAPAFAGTATIKATDSQGKEAFATVSVSVPVAISPTSSAIGEGDTISFSASGGISPYTYRIASGSGSINSVTGLFDATGVTNDSAVIEVKDSSNNTAYASVVINPALIVVPQITTIGFSEQVNFSTSGGNPPYTYAVLSGGGTIDASTGVFSGPAGVGTTFIRVVDSSGNQVDSVVEIVDKPQIDRPRLKVATNDSLTFSATNGATPYTFSVVSGGGTIDSNTGAYTAPSAKGPVTVKVTDLNGNSDSTSVEVFQPRMLALGQYQTCALDFKDLDSSIAKCWGRKSFDNNLRGLIGEDKNFLLADQSDELLDYLPSLNLGSGVQARGVVTGYYFSCAVTTDNRIKCFGDNDDGALGIGHRTDQGDYADTTGDNLNFLDLGSGRTVNSVLNIDQALSIRNHSACAILDNNALRCWGYNGYGKLGHGHSNDIADSVTEIGDNQPNVDLGGLGATSVGVGNYHICATLSNGELQCWGAGGYGRTGRESTATTGDTASTTPSNLIPIDLGTGRSAVKVCAGADHNCVLLDGGDVKCFGRNYAGVLGLERQVGSVGGSAGEMGDNLPVLDLGTGRSATDIACGENTTCAVLDNGKVKCWGHNEYGLLGTGTSDSLGYNTGDMGDSLPAVELGTGALADKVTGGHDQMCARLTTGEFKCWGYNYYATLGQGHRYHIGISLLSMGDRLDPIQFYSDKNIVQLSANNLSSCAVFDDSSASCWGLNSYGSRGGGNLVRGDESSEMGPNLPSLNLGANPNFKEIKSHYSPTCARDNEDKLFCFGEGAEGALALGYYDSKGDKASEWGDNMSYVDFGAVSQVKNFAVGWRGACALLANDLVKCWGKNDDGQLGLGDSADRGQDTAHIGDNFATTDLGSVSTVVELSAGYEHRCARFANGKVKCWGYNLYGQLGLGDNVDRGDDAGEMGDNLPFIDLGSGVESTQICSGHHFNCSLFSNEKVKCWGYNYHGQLGQGHTDLIGNNPGEMGDNLPFIDFGAGLSAKKLACGGGHACALMSDKSVKCWGYNEQGQLGNGTTWHMGDHTGEMADTRSLVKMGTNRYAVDVFAGSGNTCVTLENNDIKCFGTNNEGQLGLGHRSDMGGLDVTAGDFLPRVEIE